VLEHVIQGYQCQAPFLLARKRIGQRIIDTKYPSRVGFVVWLVHHQLLTQSHQFIGTTFWI